MLNIDKIDRLYFHSDWGKHFMNYQVDSILTENKIIRSNTTSTMTFKYYSEYYNSLIKNEIIYNNTWSKTDFEGNFEKFIKLLRVWASDFNNKRSWNGEELKNTNECLYYYKTYKNSKFVIPEIIIMDIGNNPH
jgi:hypothetical protein